MPKAKSKSPTRSWILTDVEQGIWLDRFTINAAKAKLKAAGKSARTAGAAWSITKRTLHGGLADGVDIVEIDNGAFAFSVLPTRGMNVWRGEYRGLAVGWKSPVRGPVHPKFVNLADRAGLGWLQGFDEMVARCGLDSNGAPCVDSVIDNNGNPRNTSLPLHGRIANSPACHVRVEVVPGAKAGELAELAVCGVVEESMLFSPNLRLTTRISTRVGSNCFTIDDEVTNLRGIDAELEILYHCNFGPPFLEAGSRLVAPSLAVAPRDARATEDIATYATYRGPTPGYVEQVYFHELAGQEQTAVGLVNAAADKALALRISRDSLPCFAQWKNTIPLSDGYVTGLEPGTNLPNAKPFERAAGRVVRLSPGGSWKGRLQIAVLDSARGVAEFEREVAGLAAGRARVVHDKPRSEWSSGI